MSPHVYDEYVLCICDSLKNLASGLYFPMIKPPWTVGVPDMRQICHRR